MRQLNSLPPPERRVPVVSVSLVVCALVRSIREPLYRVGRKQPEEFRGLPGESDNCQRLAGKVQGLREGEGTLPFLVAMGGQIAQPPVGYAQPF